jgi:Fe-S cluster biogenesis protein NfuA/nitrite reductase/ring-hydroxylating ferredoxin subunit
MDAGEQAAAALVARVEAALDEIEGLADPAARDAALAAVQAMLELYGEGFARIAEGLGADALERLAEDELVAHLLLLHGLHPVPVQVRVARGLDEVRPYLESHGGGVELLGVEDGVARLRLEGTCDGCPSSAVTLKLAVEDAVHRAAPEVERVEAEGAEPSAPAPLQIVQVGAPANGARAGGTDLTGGHFWGVVHDLAVDEGMTALDEVLGRSVLFARLDGTLYAYRPSCPACGSALAGAPLDGHELTCAGCGHRYDVRRAGRCLDAPLPGLDPLPLLAGDAGAVKVAVAPVGG